jgi:hypothetical protein
MEGMNACHHDVPLLQLNAMWRLSFYKKNERKFILSFPVTPPPLYYSFVAPPLSVAC